MTEFGAIMTRLAVLGDAAMAQPWAWRPEGEVLEARDALHISFELENVQAAATLARGLAEVPYALSLAQRAAGDLAGLVAGQPAEVFDLAPAEGEWTLRETLRHIIATEARFRTWSLWFVDHGLEGEQPADAPETEAAGDAAALIEELMAERARTDADVQRLTDADLTKPGRWAGHPVDIRFRLHRPASHLVEHAIQCENVLIALGAIPGEARQKVRAIWAARGAHERHSDPAALTHLDSALAARAAELGA